MRGFYAKSDPRKANDKGAKGAPTTALVESWVDDRRGVYVVINNGGDKDAEITDCIALFCEWDDKPKDWQVTAWQELGLPEPTMQVDTGGKSIHNYWVLSARVPPVRWRTTMQRLLEYADADRTLKNPSRVMRLPGTPHPETGELAQVLHVSDKLYDINDFDTHLPEPTREGEHRAAREFTDYEAHGLDEIQQALQCIPPRVPGTGTYDIYRNILWGLIKAVEEAGSSRDVAISMMGGHSPQWGGIEQVAGSGGEQIGAGTFWYWAKENGYRAPRRILPGPPELRSQPPEPPAEEPAPADPDPGDSLPFRPLGFDHGIYYYLPKAACQVVSLTAAQHNKSHFLQLAPLEWWAGAFSNEQGTRIDWDSAQNAIMGACVAQGVYDPSRLRGRGAWADADRVILHLGNRLVIDGRSHPITRLPKTFQSLYCYENARSMEGVGSESLSDEACAKVRDIAMGFSWETPASARLLLGWIVLAPICGALDWRPHIWLTGGAGIGKTTILTLYIMPLLAGMHESASGGTTEAGLRGQLRSDAIPVVFDEFEQNEARDKGIIQNVLALARIASSEGGRIIKGTTSGGANTFQIRSMFCVSSINVALVQKADLDRFCVLSLRKDQIGKDDWSEFEQQILETCTETNGRRLVARTLKHIPSIRRNARTLATALSQRFGRRFGDQYGTLLAGAWTLEPGGGGELDLKTATEWIDSMDWETREVDAGDADEVKCRDAILQHLIDYSKGHKAQIGELARCVITDTSMPGTTHAEIIKTLARWGIKVFRKNIDCMPGSQEACSSHCVAVSHSNQQLAAIFRETPWANNAHRAALRRLPGALPATPMHFAGLGTQRAILIPIQDNDLKS